MVCHCNRPKDSGRLGCGDECLNRMLNIECVQGTCPCGELCSNQQVHQLVLVMFNSVFCISSSLFIGKTHLAVSEAELCEYAVVSLWEEGFWAAVT